MMAKLSADLTLIFPPQWSPFRPPLGIASLVAWLRRRGHRISAKDSNISFYTYLFSPAVAAQIKDEIVGTRRIELDSPALLSIFDRQCDFAADLNLLRPNSGLAKHVGESDFVSRTAIATKSVSSYLAAISSVLCDMTISLDGISIGSGRNTVEDILRIVEYPHDIIQRFCEAEIAEILQKKPGGIYGLSCIGQDQLPFTLLLGKLLKATGCSVIVGGTVLPRLFEAGRLPSGWFGRYFDLVISHEGERPLEYLLRQGAGLEAGGSTVPGAIFAEYDVLKASRPVPPLMSEEVPTPDFSDFVLEDYLSPKITLPVLSSRGCYWGKCEFCHHGMVYGESYLARRPEDVLSTIRELSDAYGVKSFAFHDEALPPKMFRWLGAELPHTEESGWSFEALVKFEKYFTRLDFEAGARVGFRTLSFGLESASERVLKLMKKYIPLHITAEILKNAADAGIWVHCFVFFGFPGETDEEAAMTADFVMRSQHLDSVGVGVFELEHGAPISKKSADFGIELMKATDRNGSVYYDYDIQKGISARRALEWMNETFELMRHHPRYLIVNLIKRDLLLAVLSQVKKDALICAGQKLLDDETSPGSAKISDIVSFSNYPDGSLLLINRPALRFFSIPGDIAAEFVSLLKELPSCDVIGSVSPEWRQFLSIR